MCVSWVDRQTGLRALSVTRADAYIFCTFEANNLWLRDAISTGPKVRLRVAISTGSNNRLREAPSTESIYKTKNQTLKRLREAFSTEPEINLETLSAPGLLL